MTVFEFLGPSETFGADVLLVALIVVLCAHALRKTVFSRFSCEFLSGVLPFALGVLFYAVYYLILHGFTLTVNDLPFVFERGLSVACVGFIEGAFFAVQTERTPLSFRGAVVREVLKAEERVSDAGCEEIALVVSSPPREGDAEEVQRILLSYGLGELTAKEYATIIVETLRMTGNN